MENPVLKKKTNVLFTKQSLIQEMQGIIILANIMSISIVVILMLAAIFLRVYIALPALAILLAAHMFLVILAFVIRKKSIVGFVILSALSSFWLVSYFVILMRSFFVG